MRSALITAALATVLAVGACARSAADDPAAETTGSILLTADYKAGKDGALYIEGAIAEMIVRDATGREISRESGLGPLRFTVAVPGLYTIQPALRPCDGNCGYLDPRTDSCAMTALVAADVVRLHVTFRVGEPCQIHSRSRLTAAL